MAKYLSMNKEISFTDAALASPASSYTSSPSASLTTGTRSLESSFSSLGTADKGKSTRRRSAKAQAAELEQEEAEIDLLLGRTRPKHILEGCASGVGYILAGAIGACGILVLSPHVGSQKGYQTAGVAGGVVGAIVGTAIGTVQATGVVAGGIVSGVSQMVRGIATTPRAIVAPRSGKWWNANEGEWVLTHLKSEQEWLEETQPKYDEDILGQDVVPQEERVEEIDKRQSGTTAATRRTSSSSTTTYFQEGNVDNKKNDNDTSEKELNEARAQRFGVKETALYDLFGVDPDASVEDIQRRYGQISRMYSAQRAGADPEQAQAQFQALGNAYVILTNQILRDIYNEEGMAGIYGGEGPSALDNNNKNGSASGQVAIQPPSLVNPIELSSILYGSQKFAPYIGRLAAATNCYVCRKRQHRITLVDARRLQKRRVTRLALQLADRLEPWVVASRTAKKRGNKQPLELVKEEWRHVARELCQSNNGIKLVHLIGSIYSLTAAQFLGSMEAGIGMPRIHRWAKKQRIALKSCNDQVRHKFGMFVGRSSLRSLKEDAVEVMKTARTSSESEGVTEQLYKEMGDQVMEVLWTQTAVDVANTIHEAAQMVLFDQDKNADTRRYRGKGLEVLGQIFQSVYIEQPDEIKEAEAQYEKIVFFAVLDSVRRLEIAARDASFAAKQMDNSKA